MRRTAFALSIFLMTGCAGGYKASYVTGAVTKEFTTQSYDSYSKLFNKKLDECDPKNNSGVTTKGELDACMGPAFEHKTHEKIETAAKAYYAAAEAHTAAMIATNGTDEERREAARQIVEAAIDLLSLFPKGEELVKKLKSLTGAK